MAPNRKARPRARATQKGRKIQKEAEGKSLLVTLKLSSEALSAFPEDKTMPPAADRAVGAYHGLRSRTSAPRANATSHSSGEPHNAPHLSTPTSTARSSPVPPPSPASSTGLKLRLTFSDRPSTLRNEIRANRVSFAEDLVQVRHIERRSQPSSSDDTSDDIDTSDTESEDEMNPDGKPRLKLSFAKKSEQNVASSPTPSSAATPGTGLKLTFKLPDTQATGSTPASKSRKKPSDSSTPGSSGKKRKVSVKTRDATESEDELSQPQPPLKKVRLVSKTITPITPTVPTLKIKHKGKVPKRPLGVGYDSELEDAEKDPVQLSGMICRIQPEAEAELVRKAIEEGKIGVRAADGGLDMRFTPFDSNGRRGAVEIKGKLFAFITVDLPCIVEGMKSWDKKGWVKSIDVSQLLLILGPVRNNTEAENYPLPPDVNPQDFRSAHGLTAPMKNVRKRRFNKTKRTSVSAIEAVERKVNQLIQDDEAAVSVQYETLDYDQYLREASRLESRVSEGYGDGDGYGEDLDAEGEDDGYFTQQRDDGAVAEEDDEDEDDLDDLMAREVEAAIAAEDDDAGHPAASSALANGASHPAATNGADSSFAVTSASDSPAGTTAAPTPAATGAATAAATEDEASESDDDESADSDDEDGADAAERQEKRERLQETEDSLAKQLETYRKIENRIIKGKLEPKIQALRETRRVLREDLGIEDEG